MRSGEPVRVVWGYRWWLVLLCGAAVIAAYAVSSRGEPTYRASALLQLVSGRQTAGEFVGQEELLQLTNMTAEIVRTEPVAEAAAAQLDGTSVAAVQDAVDISTRAQVQILEVAATAEDPEPAAAIANAYADAIVSYLEEQNAEQRRAGIEQIQERVRDIERELARASETSPTAFALNAELEALQGRAADLQARLGDTARLIQSASPPSGPASPQPLRDAVLAGLLALVVGSGGALLRHRLTDRYGSVDELAGDVQLPVLGEIPRGVDEVLTMEAVRALRTNVTFAFRDRPHPALVVTSASPGSGKSHLSILLARSFVDDGRRVALVDADLRRPVLHERLPVERQPGIGDLITSDPSAPHDLTTQYVALSATGAARGGDLDVVSAGRHVGDPAEALGSTRMQQALSTLRQAYDVVLVDTPPLLAVVDPIVVSRNAEGVVLVVDVGRERRADVRQAVGTLRAVDAPLLGIVANGTESRRRYGYYGIDGDGSRGGDPIDVR